MNAPDPQARVISVFNLVAPGYDDTALRFFPFCADRLVTRLAPAAGSKLLDIATGTGAVALAAAQAVGDRGRVTAIDLAEAMLDRLQEKIVKFGIRNVDLHAMDARALGFRRDYFDNVVCSFGLFLLPDMAAGLREWVRVLKSGGRVMFTAFGESAFQPMMQRLIERLERFGVAGEGDKPCSGARLADPARCHELLDQAGLAGIDVTTEQFGYHLKDEAQWWDVIWNSGMRGKLESVPPPRREAFKVDHLAEIRPLVTGRGLWLDVTVHIASGVKPAAVR